LIVPRSNKLFLERGLQKKILYQLCLSSSRNPDFVVKHPNETLEKNKANYKLEIKTRVEHEEQLRQEILSVRLAKRTSMRRLNQFE